MGKSALLVVDVQKYFINKNTKNLPNKIRKFIQDNRKDFDYILFTKFVNSKDSNFVKITNWRKCISSPETDIHPTLAEFFNRKNSFVKTSFSAFKSRKFVDFLKKSKINKIFVCGTDTEACVFSTAIDAFDAGYKVKVLKELCGSHKGKKFHKMGKLLIEDNLEPPKT